ncbi:ATP-dependent helicase [Brevibacillus agri]|uniref:ATP-dependent helicase n=1 Tax=Brevibacillus agri TaxID=51101 RepID=UPI0002A4FB68|nr:ATP-dependent helicase [Brevibacillus agri]ELK39069.1 ATP-dependent DNA helicase PcrA [Brevibacillus agri BAB-2500]MDR9504729.1 ATP-dependent helicase [Brevibacillus agri]
MSLNLLQGLNAEQTAAATSKEPVILCLAGAGTGKTKTLTTRISYLHEEKRVGTSNMLALTFTRLAGLEMKERIAHLIGEEQAKKLFCNTFHSFCVSVLREWGHRVGLEPNFSIYDQEDQEAIIAAILGEFRYDAKVRQVLDDIALLVRGGEENFRSYESEQAAREYLFRLKQSNAISLDDLLTKTLELMRQDDIATYYRNQYKYVYVDEFQDTDNVQMDIIRAMAPENLFVVGDDYQAIYGFRGANVQNILDFPKQYPNCEVIKLERNYRSTAPIVEAANTLIKHNENRTDKRLVNERDGQPIELVEAPLTVEEEAHYVVATAYFHVQKGGKLSDIAVLARTNGQLEIIKDKLAEAKMAAVVVNKDADPLKRTDIKKLISFMSLVVNPKDEKALWSCINFPANRMTDLERATLLSKPSWSSERPLDVLRAEGSPKVQDFARIVDTLRNFDEIRFFDLDAYEAVRQAGYAIGLKAYYEEKGLQNRIDDMLAALRYVKRWCIQQEAAGERNNIEAFLKWLRIRDIQDYFRKDEDAVQLLTVHGSKGLEFDTVILVGMNQGTFPSKRTVDMEEERRLMYVAVTRAKRRLILTRPREIALYGKKFFQPGPSQFIREMGLMPAVEEVGL